MKRLSLLIVLGLLMALVLGGCPKKQETVEAPPPPPTRTETPAPADTQTTVEPERPTQVEESQFQTVYFDFDKYNLRSDAKSALDANGTLLKEHANVVVRIEGHCDERGTVEYNLSLGEKRARSCMDYLSGLGVDAGRLSVVSYGEERPAVQGTGEEAWAQNRRAEFRIVSQ